MKADKRMQLVDLGLWQRNLSQSVAESKFLCIDKAPSESDLRSVEIGN